MGRKRIARAVLVARETWSPAWKKKKKKSCLYLGRMGGDTWPGLVERFF
jgi:hypothetical protein